MGVIEELIEDYTVELIECQEAIAMLEEKIDWYRKRILEIDDIVEGIKQRDRARR